MEILFDTVAKYNEYGGQTTLHPLVSVVDLAKAPESNISKMTMGIYNIVLKDKNCGPLGYGRNEYDYEEGSLVFFSPGQVVRPHNTDGHHKPMGLALAFHPDLLFRTALGNRFSDFTFFQYSSNEALHLSEEEKKMVLECFGNINREISHPIDKHSKNVIIANLELLLNYCVRFYDRQFITREKLNAGILARFEKLLNDYFQSNKPLELGLPTVNYCAENLFLSANYFGDLIKKETGLSAQEHIHNKIIELSKLKFFEENKTLSTIALELGFKTSQHFSKLFKQKTGVTPLQFRSLN